MRINLERRGLTDPADRAAFAEAVLSAFAPQVAAWRKGAPHDRRTNVGGKKLRQRAALLDSETEKRDSRA